MRRITFALALALAAAQPALAFDAGDEAGNLAKTTERWTREQVSVRYQWELRRRNVAGALERNEIVARDPERSPVSLCAAHLDGCAGDPRMYDFERHGVVVPVGFTNRNGAHISGHLWAPRPRPGEPPRSLPAVVIVTGSIQPSEQMYWHAAQVIAQRGYVVLTFDMQGQGRSDAVGAGGHRLRGVPARELEHFVGGTVDALDFALSTADDPYVPRGPEGEAPGSGEQSEAQAKQERRAAEGYVDAWNPLAERIDRGRVGLVGHSLGASAVSLVGQADPRVDAIVAWNNLEAPEDTPLTKPSLGISGDYGLTPEPYKADPDPEARNAAFHAFRERAPDVDVMQIAIRGGTHWEYAYIPNPAFTATLRGIDLADWYTAAWLDRYVAGDPRAAARLLTDRWRDDAVGASVDRRGDGNLFSFYYRSRVAIGEPDGTRASCADLRAGCDALVPRERDGFEGEWSYLREREGS